MKIRTNLKAGEAIDPGDDEGGLFNAVSQQATRLATSIGTAMDSLKQGFSDLLGLA